MNQETIKKLLGPHKTVAVTGAQWGDEGKGKIVDLLSQEAEIVARGTGGANAGHTILVGDEKLILHLVPSGIRRDNDGVTTICGNGMVVDPFALIKELKMLEEKGVSYNRLNLAYNASLIIPLHILTDQLRERQAGNGKIGTTGRGIGPAYTDKVARIGLIVNDMLNPDTFVEKLRKNTAEHMRRIGSFPKETVDELRTKLFPHLAQSDDEVFNFDAVVETYLGYGRELSPLIVDTDRLMWECVGKRRILLEGAQGQLLSVESGTYPYVTSSDSSVAGLARGVGLKEGDIDYSIAVTKAFYMTRVGTGPFPTELGGSESDEWCNNPSVTRKEDEDSRQDASVNSADEFVQGVGIRIAGNEYGSTTLRPRRVGWLDLPMLRYTQARTGGVLALTLLDVLDGCEVIKLCTGYEYAGPDYRVGNQTYSAGVRIETPIMEETILRNCKPIYQEFPGWLQPIGHLTEQSQLPQELMTIIRFVEAQTDARVALVSVGPERDQTILWQ
ncbi:MAG: adenylosuccinate synthetase [Patescibacteria group bacterium]